MQHSLRKLSIIIVAILTLVLISSSAYSKELFEIELTSIQDRISVEDVAIYNVTIINNKASTDEFRVYILSFPEWDLRTEPLISPVIVEVSPFSRKTIQVYLDPLHVTAVGNYQVDIYARSQITNDVKSAPMEIRIKSTEPLIEGYVPTVILSLDAPKKIDPKDKIKISVKLANQNLLDYPEIKLIISSNLINDEIKDKLGPKEEKTIEIVKEFPIELEPQNDKLTITLLRGNRTVAWVSQPFEVIGYTNLKMDTEYKRKLLKTEKHVKFTNEGNLESEVPLKVKADTLKSIFTVTKPKSAIKKEGDIKYYVWDQNIQPYDAYEVVIIENYRPLFLLFITAIVAVVLYYSYRAPMVFKKSSKNLIKSHGGISSMHISLSLKNRGNSTIENIEITDTIPDLVQLDKGLLIGTLHPSKIFSHEKKGTIVKWEIKSLEAGDERVITYKVKSRLAILGGVTLPFGSARFTYQGKSASVASNKLEVRI